MSKSTTIHSVPKFKPIPIITKNPVYPTKKVKNFIKQYSDVSVPFFRQLLNSINDIEIDLTLPENQIDPSLSEEETIEQVQLLTLRRRICVIHKYIDSVSYEREEYRRRIEDIEEEIKTKYYSATKEDLDRVEDYYYVHEITPDNSPSEYFYDPPDPEY